MDKITIAIDGWSSCGKSTLAKALSKALNYVYVDSGAMYRGVALYALRQGWLGENKLEEQNIVNNLDKIDLSFRFDPKEEKALLFLNDENVENEIRTIKVSEVVSAVATIKEVRAHLVSLQREFGEKGGVVMDGRDIGSVVFPNAELKLFVTADVDVRAKRRYDELKAKGDDVSLEEVKANLQKRDKMDTTRSESPLIQTKDAVVLDNTNLTPKEQLEKALNLVKNIVNS